MTQKKHKSRSAKPAAGRAKRKQVETVSKKSWGAIRGRLEVLREDLLRAVKQKEAQDIGGMEVGDEADQATSSLEKEMLFELSDNERATLDQIEGALRKMEKGIYGLCESCQKPIPKLRLQAVPFARYCISCQTSAERAAV
ncbi:MAG: TraR/DksA family transcriptional regulator [Elusimicrobia bacterium]|nr:TraR/DksA family transcriptional regulator [Elusimicrobiota bacterium]